MASNLVDGRLVDRSFNPGYVVLSFLISCIGTITTLELMHRRTSLRGWYNWYLLITSCIAMGGIGIWCMHFIGNRAIIIGQGAPEIQIIYNSGVTAASFFVPIVALVVPFCASGISEHVSRISLVICGALTGLAVCGMHYLGQAGIANYTCVYQPAYVVGSAIIAVFACTVALSIFFLLRAAWTNSWWKRTLCGVILAGGISGMHWLATVGTNYRFKVLGPAVAGSLSRRGTVIVVLILSVSTCILLFTVASIAQAQVLRNVNKAKQVVLACATFDTNGNLMVTPEGLLPSQKITNSYLEKSFEDIFNISHEAFHWIFRVTYNWRGMVDLIPGMRNHIRSIAAPKGPRLGRTLSDAGAVDANEDYSVIFKELFCVAAQDLAEQIHEPLENIGVLYNDIMSTGTIEIKKKGMQSTVTEAKDGSHDIEEGRNSSIFGRGQLLFVVRLANKVEATRLQASGFRFADTLNVADHLARSMRVTREELLSRVNDMREYSKRDRILEPGVHIACFAIRPLIRRFFDVLVRKNATNLLPTIRMPLKELDATHLEILRQMDGWTVAACLNWLRSKLSFANKSEEVFVGQLYDSFTALVQEVQDPFFLRARFVGHPMTAPCRSLKEGQVPGKATVLAFCIMTDIHASTSNSRLTFSPFNLFKCQQYVYENAKDHEKFAKEVHREFAPILQSDVYPYFNASSQATPNSSNLARDDNTRSPTSGVNWSWPFSNKTPHSQAELVKDDNSSERSLVEGGSNKAFGGITVRNEIRVDISDALNHSDDDVELGSMPTHKAPSLAAAKGDGFVDELFALTVDSSRW